MREFLRWGKASRQKKRGTPVNFNHIFQQEIVSVEGQPPCGRKGDRGPHVRAGGCLWAVVRWKQT